MSGVTEKNITPLMTRAGRAILEWSTRDLAAKAKIGVATVWRFEQGESIRNAGKAAMIKAFQDHGVELLNDGKPGARLAANDNPSRQDCA